MTGYTVLLSSILGMLKNLEASVYSKKIQVTLREGHSMVADERVLHNYFTRTLLMRNATRATHDGKATAFLLF